MSDIVLSAASKTQVTLHDLQRTLARAATRLQRNESGQDLIEYAGILAVVAIIIAALIAVAPNVASAITSAVGKIIKG